MPLTNTSTSFARSAKNSMFGFSSTKSSTFGILSAKSNTFDLFSARLARLAFSPRKVARLAFVRICVCMCVGSFQCTHTLWIFSNWK